MITIKHLQMNQILLLNNPLRVDMPLNKPNQPNPTEFLKRKLAQMQITFDYFTIIYLKFKKGKQKTKTKKILQISKN